MKYLNIACGLLMILFAGVQFNDPDGLLWAAIYLVPAIWAGILAFRPHLIQNTLPFGLLGLSAAAELIGGDDDIHELAVEGLESHVLDAKACSPRSRSRNMIDEPAA